jgi:hypothetical protein
MSDAYKSPEPRREGQAGVSRRKLFGLGAGVVAGGVVAGAATAAHDPNVVWGVSGTVERIEDERTMFVGTTDAGVVQVELAPGADVRRDGPAALRDFSHGDEVAAAGAFADSGIYRAVAVESIFRAVETTVVSRSAGRLATDDGDITLDHSTRPRALRLDGREWSAKEVAAVEAGDRIAAVGRLDGATQNLIADQIGTLE